MARRLAAQFYDALLLLGVLFFASIPFTLVSGITYGSPWYGVYVVYAIVLSFLFFGWFWTHGGQTLGMKTWQIQLRCTTGASVDWTHVALRFVFAFLPWLPLAIAGALQIAPENTWHRLLLWLPPGIAWASAFANREGITWYDHFSATRLARLNPRRVCEKKI